MSTSVYRIMEIIGSSSGSWEEAARTAVEKAGIHREDLRVAEVVEFDMRIDNKQVVAYRVQAAGGADGAAGEQSSGPTEAQRATGVVSCAGACPGARPGDRASRLEARVTGYQ
jgi:flavin-binding protein dodecin